MLRLLAFAFVLLTVLVVGMPKMQASAPAANAGMEVRGDDGVVLGRLYDIVRDGNGRVIAARVEGLEEPADAPIAPDIAEGDVRDFLAAAAQTEG